MFADLWQSFAFSCVGKNHMVHIKLDKKKDDMNGMNIWTFSFISGENKNLPNGEFKNI